MIYHFSQVAPKDIFYGEHYDWNGNKAKHYFYCIYSQTNDKTHNLYRDIIGLLVTTKEPKGYYVTVTINDKTAYVCCDVETRFFANIETVQNKYIQLTDKEHKMILKCYKRFTRNKIKQIKKGENK